MPQVSLSVAGRVYRVACGEGEEERLFDLGQALNRKIELLKKDFGEIGDQRLTVMAGLTLADELEEANRKVLLLEAELSELKAAPAEAPHQKDWSASLAERLSAVAERIERATEVLNGDSRETQAQD
jgi:cell division protein ZapA